VLTLKIKKPLLTMSCLPIKQQNFATEPSKTPLQAMKDWHKLKSALFKKLPYYLPGCDGYATPTVIQNEEETEDVYSIQALDPKREHPSA
jgi:hypothetical protein